MALPVKYVTLTSAMLCLLKMPEVSPETYGLWPVQRRQYGMLMRVDDPVKIQMVVDVLRNYAGEDSKNRWARLALLKRLSHIV